MAFLATAGGLLVVLLRRRHRREIRAEGVSPERGELRAVFDASLLRLDEDRPPREAVIHAYASMEEVLARHGLMRRPSEAPFEYLARWTNALHVGRTAAEALTYLYERARFSLHLIDEEMKQEAIAALTTLRDELAGEA